MGRYFPVGLNAEILDKDMMPFCHNCGGEVEEDWNNCPVCSVSLIKNTKITSDFKVAKTEAANAENNENGLTRIYKEYTKFESKIGKWASENRLKAALIAFLFLGSIIAINILKEDEGLVVKYTVTNYNCSNVEAQYIQPDGNVKVVSNLREGETFEIEVSGFEQEDLVGVTGVNRGSGYCTIIVKMYSLLYFDDVRHDTAGQGESISLAGALV